MKAQFIDTLVSTVWNIDKLRGRTIIGHMVATLLKSERPSEDIFEDPLPKLQIFGDVAVIPLRGVIKINVPDWIKSWGLNLTDANDIEQELDTALANPNVRFIVFDTDSPGGSALAGEKLFDIVEAANRRKPVFGFCGDGAGMASTAFLAVASARAIYSGYYAEGVGCVGSYLAYLDDTEYYANMGLKFRVFRSGDLKGIGEDELSEAQAAYLQAKVDKAGATFRSKVSKYRTSIAAEDMQGQWFDGITAAQRGFVAGNVKDLSEAIAKFRTMI